MLDITNPLEQTVKKNEYDIVHTHSYNIYLLAHFIFCVSDVRINLNTIFSFKMKVFFR